MNYYQKYLKYKTKYLELKQNGGTIDKNILFFEEYLEDKFKTPKILDELNNNLIQSSDLEVEECNKLTKLHNIFNIICTRTEYDESFNNTKLFDLNDDIEKYLGINTFFGDSNTDGLTEAFGALPLEDSELEKDYNKIIANNVELNKVLKNIYEYLECEYESINKNEVKYNSISVINSVSNQQIFIDTEESNAVFYEDKPIKIWIISKNIIYQKGNDYYQIIIKEGEDTLIQGEGRSEDILIQEIDIIESINGFNIYKGDKDEIKELYPDGTRKTVKCNFMDSKKIPKNCFTEKSEKSFSDTLNGPKVKLDVVKCTYQLNIKSKKITSPLELPDKYNYILKQGYSGTPLLVPINSIKNIYLDYNFTEDEFNILKRKIINNTDLNKEEKDKLKNAIIIYLVLNKKYPKLNPSTKTIWEYLKIQSQNIDNLYEVIKLLENEFKFNINNEPFFNELQINIFKTNIIDKHFYDMNKFIKSWFIGNNYLILSQLLKNNTDLYDPDVLSTDVLTSAISRTYGSYHLGYIILMDPINFIGAVSHEIGHIIYSDTSLQGIFKTFINKYYKPNEQYFGRGENNKTYNEFIADFFSVLCLDKYLELYTNNDYNQQINIIKKWFLFNCTPSMRNAISSGHPHHSFRINTLLLSKRVYKIMCTYVKNLESTQKPK
jgi:hypothetical protein